MTRTDIINAFIGKNGYKSYLEIGVQRGDNFALIGCEKKVGVDPDLLSKAIIHQPSDQFFKENEDKFDIIFIDGLHHADQVYKDINNALKCLNKGGTIVCHDMNPQTEYAQQIPIHPGFWNGDCWKAWVQLRSERKDLEMFVIDTDHGCGVIRKGKQELLEEPVYEWEFLNEFRKDYLNLITVEQFKKLI